MLKLILITALALYGSKVLWLEGMIFEKPKLWLDKVFGDSMIRKPLYACPACMASVWGSVIYWWSVEYSHYALFFWPVFCISVCGMVWILMYQFPYDE